MRRGHYLTWADRKCKALVCESMDLAHGMSHLANVAGLPGYDGSAMRTIQA